MLKVKQNCY